MPRTSATKRPDDTSSCWYGSVFISAETVYVLLGRPGTGMRGGGILAAGSRSTQPVAGVAIAVPGSGAPSQPRFDALLTQQPYGGGVSNQHDSKWKEVRRQGPVDEERSIGYAALKVVRRHDLVGTHDANDNKRTCYQQRYEPDKPDLQCNRSRSSTVTDVQTTMPRLWSRIKLHWPLVFGLITFVVSVWDNVVNLGSIIHRRSRSNDFTAR